MAFSRAAAAILISSHPGVENPLRVDYSLRMPTIFRKDGFRFFIYTDDHEPAHVHVLKGRAEVKISLGGEDASPRVMRRKQMANEDAIRAMRIVLDHHEELVRAWRRIHG